MKLLHTKLPEFIKKMQTAAAEKGSVPKDIEIIGLENLRSAKMQSLRTGRIEHAVGEVAALENVEKLELIMIPRVPETMQTVIVKGIGKDGKCEKAVLEIVNVLHPTEEAYLLDCAPENIDDRRPAIGNH
ncbi:MAG: hypothetical protein LUE88_06620 [Clostridiales bacterium]|nr:hypothetical protein [Clostridiales bacterium]